MRAVLEQVRKHRHHLQQLSAALECPTGRWPAPVHHVMSRGRSPLRTQGQATNSIPIVLLGSLASISGIRMDLMAESSLASGWLRCYSWYPVRSQFGSTPPYPNRKGGHAQRDLGAAGGFFPRAGVGRRRVGHTLSLITPLIYKLNHFWGRGRTLRERPHRHRITAAGCSLLDLAIIDDQSSSGIYYR